MPAPLTYDEWLTGVPALLDEVAQSWGLTPGRAYPPGAVGHAVRVELADGTPAVLKLSNPDREILLEPDALERWDGDGAVRLLARDDARHAILLERCEPGTFLSAASSEDTLGVFVGLLPRLWKSGDGFASLEDEAAIWIDEIEREVHDPKLRGAALSYLRDLPSTQGDQVLLHQDLHGENVLAAEREPWLVIDPKPLTGEREFAVAPIVRSFELGQSKRDALYRLDRVTSELGLDRDRARAWTIGQTMAWAFDSEYHPTHLETVRWLLEDAE
jgi:streptomycin 6-kinase